MSLPYFYVEDVGADEIRLQEETSKHMIGVLRMKAGDNVHLTDGQGNLVLAVIENADRKKCTVRVLNRQYTPRDARRTIIAISLLKNANRLEWFMEKATELGITAIIPLLCHRTEKQHFRAERMKNILVSALLQSQQVWLPVLHQPIGFEQLLRMEDSRQAEQKFIAHCLPDTKSNLSELVNRSLSSQIVLIGPEGDFTKEEVDLACSCEFVPVSLGSTRLRTETAGVVAAAILRA